MHQVCRHFPRCPVHPIHPHLPPTAGQQIRLPVQRQQAQIRRRHRRRRRAAAYRPLPAHRAIRRQQNQAAVIRIDVRRQHAPIRQGQNTAARQVAGGQGVSQRQRARRRVKTVKTIGGVQPQLLTGRRQIAAAGSHRLRSPPWRQPPQGAIVAAGRKVQIRASHAPGQQPFAHVLPPQQLPAGGVGK